MSITPANTQFLYLFGPLYGENYFNYSTVIDPIFKINTPVPEFIGKDLKYFQDAVAANMQIRHVVVYGSVKSGRNANIDWNDYEAVKTALNLKD